MIEYQKEYEGCILAGRVFPNGHSWVCNLIIPQQKTRQGLGTEFYNEFEQKCVRENCEYVFLEIFTHNLIGKKFWKSLGFEFAGELCDQEYELWSKEL